MRTNEIQVGTDYAYAHSSYAICSKVHVLETGVERKQGWRGNTVRNGVRVRYANGHEGVVASREIREEWAPYAERLEAQRKARLEMQEQARRAIYDRARQAKVLDDYLAGHGEEARSVHFYGADVKDALRAAGFEVLTTDENSLHSNLVVKTRIKSIREFVAKGQVNVADLTPVLADLAHRLPKGA